MEETSISFLHWCIHLAINNCCPTVIIAQDYCLACETAIESAICNQESNLQPTRNGNMASLFQKLRNAWEVLGYASEGEFFVGYGRVVSKQKVWDSDAEMGNAAYLFTVIDETHNSSISFRASPAFPDCARAKPGDRICYTYLFWGSILPVNLKLAKAQ